MSTFRLSKVLGHLQPLTLPTQIVSSRSCHAHVQVQSGYNTVTSQFVELIKLCVNLPDSQVYWSQDKSQNGAQELKERQTDKSHHGLHKVDLLVYPLTTEEVARILPACAQHKIAVTVRTTGTGLEGGSIPFHGGLMIDMSKMKSIVELDETTMMITVQPGIKKDALNEYLKQKGYFWPVDPASNAGIGGYASTGASGTLTVKYKTIRENIVCLKVVTVDGKIITTRRKVSKSSVGYNLTQLFIGAEGTLGITTEITLRILRTPSAILAAVARFSTTKACAQTVQGLAVEQVGSLARAELINAVCMKNINAYSNTNYPIQPTLLLEFHGATQTEVLEAAKTAERVAKEFGCSDFQYTTDEGEREKMWQARRDVYFASFLTKTPPEGKKLQIFATDVCVPMHKLAQLIDETERDAVDSGTVCPIVGHVGDGNFHSMVPYIDGDHVDMKLASDLNDRLINRCLSMGGTCSGEHGVGVGKKAGLVMEHGEDFVDVMRKIKKALDPNSILNPDKVFDLLKKA